MQKKTGLTSYHSPFTGQMHTFIFQSPLITSSAVERPIFIERLHR